jgi:hypothetical protein
VDTYLSRVAAKMYLPFGENLTKDTGGLSSSVEKILYFLIIKINDFQHFCKEL